MIGNDIVDLVLARKESNWKRKGFLEKIFSEEEQLLISKSENSEKMVWILWSNKEAVYKIYNRETGIRGYIPLRINILEICSEENSVKGKVECFGKIYHTKAIVNSEYVYTIAVKNLKDFNSINSLDSVATINDNLNRPFYFDEISKKTIPVSKTHHGRFLKIVSL